MLDEATKAIAEHGLLQTEVRDQGVVLNVEGQTESMAGFGLADSLNMSFCGPGFYVTQKYIKEL